MNCTNCGFYQNQADVNMGWCPRCGCANRPPGSTPPTINYIPPPPQPMGRCGKCMADDHDSSHCSY